MKIQILGVGCARCDQLAANVAQAIAELGLDCQVEKVTGLNDIMRFGVMMTPALAVDGEVKAVGRVPPPDEIKALLA